MCVGVEKMRNERLEAVRMEGGIGVQCGWVPNGEKIEIYAQRIMSVDGKKIIIKQN